MPVCAPGAAENGPPAPPVLLSQTYRYDRSPPDGVFPVSSAGTEPEQMV